MRRYLVILLFIIVSLEMQAQFKETRGSITAGPPGSDTTSSRVNPESSVPADSIGGFSIRKMFRGLAHKDTLTPGYLLFSSIVMPGSAQIYNKDYWKLPVVYGGIGGAVYMGIKNNRKYHQTGDNKYANYRNYCFAGAGFLYWGTIMDGIVGFKSDKRPDPGKAMLYSALLPGLGQAYNGDWWHIPIWYGGFLVCGYTYHINDIEYKRFKNIYKMASNSESGYIGHITADQAKWYRDLYRRYRDYSIVASILVYALNVIDANVFAYMSDFNVSDDLSFNVKPTIIEPLDNHLFSTNSPSAFGFQMQLKF